MAPKFMAIVAFLRHPTFQDVLGTSSGVMVSEQD